MKTMKQLSAAVLVGLGLASSAFAADGLTVSGDVHGATAYQFRGHQFSDGEPSLGLKVTAAHSSGLFGSVQTDTVKLTDGSAQNQFQSALTVGYARDVGYGVTVDGGVSRHFFSGKGDVSDLSFSEAFVGAKFQGLHAKLSTVVEGAKVLEPGLASGDVYGELGYTHHIGKFNVGADVGYSWFDGKHVGAKDGLSVAQVRAGYALNDQVDFTLTHQFAGDDAYGDKASGTHKTFLKVSYKF